jgi:ribonuclease Z
MLDAGPQCYNQPSHIFITHTHGDHIANLPFTLIADSNVEKVVQLYGPKDAEKHVRKYISCLFEVNSMLDSDEMPDCHWFDYNGYNDTTINEFRILLNKSPYLINVVECDHAIKTVSYCFSIITKKLKGEYTGLPGKEIAVLRKSGVEITEEIIKKKFAFICDSSIQVLVNNPIILTFPMVMIECTFLYPEEEENANITKHIHWYHLKPYVIDNPSTLFVLIHFSLRYKDEEIIEFFEKEKLGNNNLNNIKIWAGETNTTMENWP